MASNRRLYKQTKARVSSVLVMEPWYLDVWKLVGRIRIRYRKAGSYFRAADQLPQLILRSLEQVRWGIVTVHESKNSSDGEAKVGDDLVPVELFQRLPSVIAEGLPGMTGGRSRSVHQDYWIESGLWILEPPVEEGRCATAERAPEG